MAKQLRIDFEELEKTITVYKNIADQFKTVKDQANTAMKILEETKWKSSASEAFFDTYSTNWVKAFDDHIKSLDFLTDQLEDVEKKYEDLYEGIDKIANAVRDAL